MAKRIVIPEKPNTKRPADSQLLGQAVRYVRTSVNLSIEDAAALAGVSKQSLNDIELGKSGCRTGTAFKVLEALGIKLRIELPVMLDTYNERD